ncbi:MAG: HAD-IA family hydrolase [Magnetospirillum sp.]|jgi:HAD superfamily hydrolase (TIGR01509 family)|nr:HAD-IA family hydrolase [Magnetospirillum sp.]
MRDTLLFDLDGTLTDTDALHFAAYGELLAPFGKSITLETYKQRIMGAANAATMAWLLPDEDAEEMSQRKERLFRARVDELTPTAGLGPLLAWAAKLGLRTAVVTNAMRPNTELMLKALRLDARFDTIVIADELARGKPDPLPYTTALERLGVAASQALAFEDSRAGIAAAVAAGVETVGLTTGLDAATLRGVGARIAVADFADPQLSTLLATSFGSAPALH